MKKQVLSIILAFVIIIGSIAAISTTAFAGDIEFAGTGSSDDVYYTYGDYSFRLLNDGTLSLDKYKGSAIDLFIPSKVEGKKVSVIDYCAFDGCNSLETVTIPEGIVSIEQSAFSYCNSLTSVKIPESVKFIGNLAFLSCTKLKDISIGSSLDEIEYGILWNTAYYNDKSNWENGLLYLGNNLLAGRLVKYNEKKDEYYNSYEVNGTVNVKPGTRLIADEAFYDCPKLTGVTLPSSIERIGSKAFVHTAFYNDKNNWKNEVLYIDDCLISGFYQVDDWDTEDISIITEVSVKPGTRIIADKAFLNCVNLTQATIANGVEYIGRSAFLHCPISSITIPDSVECIGAKAFYQCEHLSNLKLGTGLKSILEYAFDGCLSLTEVTIPKNVENIETKAFGYCAFYMGTCEDEYKMSDFSSFHIYCSPNSSAEKYAKANAFDYTLVDYYNLTINKVHVNGMFPYGTKINLGQYLSTSSKVEFAIECLNTNKVAVYNFNVFNDDGELVQPIGTVRVTFDIPVNFEPNKTGVYYISDDGMTERVACEVDIENNKITAEIKHFSIYALAEKDFIYGDSNGDGDINMLDVLLMRKYIAKQPVLPNLDASDVNNDDNVNMLDVLLLRKYIAKQPVTLGPQE